MENTMLVYICAFARQTLVGVHFEILLRRVSCGILLVDKTDSLKRSKPKLPVGVQNSGIWEGK